MKKMSKNWVGVLIALITITFTYSCSDFLDDNYLDYPWLNADKASIATIQNIDGSEEEYYFLLDGGQKLYPGDLKGISSSYKWKDGQRAVVYFNMLPEEKPGYEYNAEVMYIDNILTKGIIPLTEATADSIGDDKIDIIYATYGINHINLQFLFWGTRNPKDLHMVNLVRNETGDAQTDDNYIVLEFRHNAYNDYQAEKLKGIASFRLDLTEEETTKYKGIKIRTNSIYEGIKYQTYDFNLHEQNGTKSKEEVSVVR